MKPSAASGPPHVTNVQFGHTNWVCDWDDIYMSSNELEGNIYLHSCWASRGPRQALTGESAESAR
jgi:hypothetical protein